jgi:hypothetical protein
MSNIAMEAEAEQNGHGDGRGAREVLSRRLRLLVVGVLGAGLIWAIATHSLVAALVESRPQWALAIKPDDPGALMALAERAIERERARAARLAKSAPNAADDADIDNAPNPGLDDDLRRWATAAVAQEPGNARALAILGDLARRGGDEGTAATLLDASARHSMREPLALGWQIEKALKRRDWQEVARYTDAMLRYYREAFAPLSPLLAQLLQDAEAAPAVKDLLATAPPWRKDFLPVLLEATADPRAPLDLLLSLKATPHPPTVQELRQYLAFLIKNQFFDLAYYAWLQFLPPQQLARAGMIFNGGFETRPSGLQFDWEFERARSSGASIERRGDRASERVLVIRLGPGRAEIDYISQVIRLQPGHYRVKGSALGNVQGVRGMRWRVRCLGAQHQQIAESEMLVGRIAQWTEFFFDVNVPSSPACIAQELRLVLDARTPSEQLASGNIFFDDLSVSRVP